MTKVFSFEDKIRDKNFEKQVVDKISNLNSFYDFETEGDLGIAFLHLEKFFCIFFRYVPRSETTTLPTIEDSLNGISKTEEVYSTGEWFVESLYKLEKKDYFQILPYIYKKEKKPGWLEYVMKLADNST